jgi:antitoxin HigA-1
MPPSNSEICARRLGNRLEALQGNRADQHSIRINDQWRICFRWGAKGPEDVAIVDYHRKRLVMARLRTHPGEILSEEFLIPLGLSARRLAGEMDVPPNRVSEIVRGRRDVTADTAIRLSRRFGTTPQFWLNLQNAHDLSKAKATKDHSKVKHCI